jgi:hypothetical protein
VKYKLLLALLSIALVSSSVWAAKGGNKPKPIPQPNHAVWVDANDVMLGVAQDGTSIYFDVNGGIYEAILLGTDDLGVGFWGVLYYDGPGCTGNAYIRGKPTMSGGVETVLSIGKNGTLYTVESVAPRPVYIASGWGQEGGDARCNEWDSIQDAYDAVPLIDTSAY